MAGHRQWLSQVMTELHRLGTSDLMVSPLALGGNTFGWTSDEPQSHAVLDAYAAAGGNFIDTADVYSAWIPGHEGGESERVIGSWMASRGNRASTLVATKVGRHAELANLKPETIRKGAEASLRRLGTDYIDLYYTHFDDESVPVEDIITALDQLVKEGKVRAIAASNISPERLDASLAFSEREGLARYVALQPHYNLVSRDTYEGPLRDVATRYGLSVVPYYALASGFLTGKYRPGTAVDSARAEGAGAHLATDRGLAVLAALDRVAEARGAELATVALAWLAAQPTIIAPLASARTPEQLKPLIDAAGLRLTAEELADLSTASEV